LALTIMVATGGNVGLAVAPLGAVAFVWLLYRLPLRISGLSLFFLSLVLERQGDSFGRYRSLFYPLGLALNAKYSTLTNVKVLQFSGMDIACVLLVLVAMLRAGLHSGATDSRVRAPRPLAGFALLFAATVLAEIARGTLAHGELSVALWQGRSLLHLPLYFITFDACLRGPEDFRDVGRTIVLAAVVRGLFIAWIRYGTGLGSGWNAITNHDDSMMLAMGIALLLIALNERTDRQSVSACVLFLPPMVLGAVLNDRRLIWVDLGFALFVYALVSPRTRLKRALLRGVLGGLPLIALYVTIGWGSQAKLFGPVKTIAPRWIATWRTGTSLPASQPARYLVGASGRNTMSDTRWTISPAYFHSTNTCRTTVCSASGASLDASECWGCGSFS